jgi:hypothetical protein
MRQLSLVAISMLAACHVSQAQVRPRVVEWPAPGSWLTVQTPRCGEVRGRVIFWPFGGADTTPRPRANALVQIGDTSRADLTRQRAAGTAATTDANGEFVLRLPDQRISVLTLRFIGLEPVVIAVDGVQYRAAAVEVGVRSMSRHDAQYGTNVQAIRGFRNCVR